MTLVLLYGVAFCQPSIKPRLRLRLRQKLKTTTFARYRLVADFLNMARYEKSCTLQASIDLNAAICSRVYVPMHTMKKDKSCSLLCFADDKYM